MRKTLLFLLLLIVKLTFGQFRDDFQDGNFKENPTWLGQQRGFMVNANKQLQTVLSAGSQVVSLCVANTLALNVQWQFTVQLNFDPSSSNLTRIYLMASEQDLKEDLNGYFIQIGESGNQDSYDLYKQSGSKITKVIDGLAKPRAKASMLKAKISVTRSELGKWELYSAIDDEDQYHLEGSAVDLTYTQSEWFGLYCKYTASRSDGFIFDDFVVKELVSDVVAPKLRGVEIVDNFNLKLLFSEPLSPAAAQQPSSYLINGQYTPETINIINPGNAVLLRFAMPFHSGNYQLKLSKMADLKGNVSEDEFHSFFYVEPYVAVKNDIVINELLADPSPPQGLPPAEFVELWNRTDKYILLKGWKFGSPKSYYTFEADTLKPNAYLLLTAKPNVSSFEVFGQTIGLSSWPTLNNDKDYLSLVSPEGTVIDELAYSNTWYRDDVKKKGGYSLELIDPLNRCEGSQNWLASHDASGGTPGKQNSVYGMQLDAEVPKLLSAELIDSLTISLTFNKPLDSALAVLPGKYLINNSIGTPVKALPQAPFFTSVHLTLAQALIKGVEYVLTVTDLSDCAGHPIDLAANKVNLFRAESIKKGDILISELLFNPKLGGVDFIEIYNQRNYPLDLKELSLSNADLKRVPLSLQTILMPAQSYWVLTRNPEVVKQQYLVKSPTQFVQMPEFPALNNDKGKIVLWNDQLLIDQVEYVADMHFPLLKGVKGVSLERTNFVDIVPRFVSAAASSGYATPTSRNSQAEDLSLVKDLFSLRNKLFSPDGDGFEELLYIDYQFKQASKVASINIYTDQGYLVRKLVKNASLGTQGTLIWDGLNDAGRPANMGIYLIKCQVFDLHGQISNYQMTCVLATKLTN